MPAGVLWSWFRRVFSGWVSQAYLGNTNHSQPRKRIHRPYSRSKQAIKQASKRATEADQGRQTPAGPPETEAGTDRPAYRPTDSPTDSDLRAVGRLLITVAWVACFAGLSKLAEDSYTRKGRSSSWSLRLQMAASFQQFQLCVLDTSAVARPVVSAAQASRVQLHTEYSHRLLQADEA